MREEKSNIDVVVLASGINHVSLFSGYVPGYKALIPYHERASIHYVLDALCATAAIGHICIEGPCALLAPELEKRVADRMQITLVEGGTTFVDSLVIGLQHFADSPLVLFVTADLPLITPEAVQCFLAACAAAPPDRPPGLYLSAVPRVAYTGAYAHFTKPFNRYKDVSLCHGNLFLADPTLLQRPALKERINRFYAGRKNAIQTTLALGWKVALVYMIGVELLHLLTLQKFADFVSRELGFGVTPILVPYPEMTIDVDEPDDYVFVRDRIEERMRT